jgi:hypothetical protein
MGEAGEDTSWNSFTERFWRGSGWTPRSLVAEHGEERDEVGKKERRKKKRVCARTDITRRTPASLASYNVPRAPARWRPLGPTWRHHPPAGQTTTPRTMVPYYSLGAPGWMTPCTRVHI